MKLQCSCGAKYAFDVTPEMAQNPVKFVCPNCGLDASDYVNQLVRQELASGAGEPVSAVVPTPAVAVPAPAPRLRISLGEPAAASAPAPAAPVPPAGPARMRIAVASAPAAATEETPAGGSKFCAKHRERAAEQCAVCHKPICPKCMAMFGFFCSPLCKGKAEAQHLDVPVYAGRKDQVEAQFWRKTGLVIGGIVGLIALLIGVWIWYAWIGSVPHKYFAVRFDDDNRAYHGNMQVVGKDQVVFLHGGTLARYDMKTQKQIWSQEMISKQDIDTAVKAVVDEEARLAAENAGGYFHRRSGADIEHGIKQELQGQLSLLVAGQNIWVSKEGLMTHFDWDTGKVLNQVTLPEHTSDVTQKGDELLMLGAESVTHISLASGESHVEKFGRSSATGTVAGAAGGGLIGLGADNGKTLDPKKVEAQAQNMKLQGRIALPALVANAMHEKQLEAALNDDPKHPRPKNAKALPVEAPAFELVFGPGSYAQFAAKMLEEHFVQHSAMKAPPKKSALDGDLNATKTSEVANEILNEMQRNAGGDSVTEDESRYQVTVHLPDEGAPDFTSDVVGPPQLHVLNTVNVIAAGKNLVVLDKANKKLWTATLTYSVPESEIAGLSLQRESKFGDGPCVEHGNTLYVFDQAVLTAFDLNSGEARWRLPSVGVVGLFFDQQDNVYVNTTSGNPDDIKYSRQIDVSRRTEAVLTKVEPKTGKALWSIKPGGFVSYLFDKYIYVVDSYDPNPDDMEVNNDMVASLQKPPFLHITRINPRDGRTLFDYYDRERCPFYVHFNGNQIELIYKREVQVLRFVSL